MAITLTQFYENNNGETLGYPKDDGTFDYVGECVSLIQHYLYQCYDIPFEPRGNAKNWIDTLPAVGIATVVTGNPQIGDIIVCPNKGNGNGHIGIFIGNISGSTNMMFEQNYGYNDDPLQKTSRAARTFSQFISGDNDYAILRINTSSEPIPELNGISLRAVTTPFRVRDLEVTGNQVALVLVDRQATILKYLPGFQSDGYQWAYVDYNGQKGFSQLDLKNDYKIVKNTAASTSYLKAVASGFYIRTAPVTGSVVTTVPKGSKAEILSFETSHSSDGYQWAKVNYNGAIGYSQIDTEGFNQLTD